MLPLRILRDSVLIHNFPETAMPQREKDIWNGEAPIQIWSLLVKKVVGMPRCPR